MKRKARKSREDECVLCRRAHSDPDVYGQTCREDSLCAHEFCLYFAEGLYQRGTDEDGFCRFLPGDIRQAVKRTARKTCCVCGKMGATVACRQKRCARKFHFPCGSERGCISQFFGEYRSFCWEHRPEQRVETYQDGDTTCIICMEPVEDRTSYSTMVCPVCKHAWFHRGCIQEHALHSALKHFACPLCKDREKFLPEMWHMGIRIPDRRAAWEEEEETFEELYETYSHCDARQCLYQGGREQSEEEGIQRAVGAGLPWHQPGSVGILPGLPGCWGQQLSAIPARQESRPLQVPAPAPKSLQPALRTAGHGTDTQPLAGGVDGNTSGLAVQELLACYSPAALPTLRGTLPSQ
ncbi:PHD finger protein 7-like [Struthio camelus]|uniref:PHD finger protein 7-like n=1 Tax=Struthio camelus TaxID=8801 RepID=UPI003604283C